MIDDKRTTLTAYDLIAAWQILHDIIQSHCVFESIDAATNNLKKAAWNAMKIYKNANIRGDPTDPNPYLPSITYYHLPLFSPGK